MCSTSIKLRKLARRWSIWWKTCPLPSAFSAIKTTIDLRFLSWMTLILRVVAVDSNPKTSDCKAASRDMSLSQSTRPWAKRVQAKCLSTQRFMNSQRITRDPSRKREETSIMPTLTTLQMKWLTIWIKLNWMCPPMRSSHQIWTMTCLRSHMAAKSPKTNPRHQSEEARREERTSGHLWWMIASWASAKMNTQPWLNSSKRPRSSSLPQRVLQMVFWRCPILVLQGVITSANQVQQLATWIMSTVFLSKDLQTSREPRRWPFPKDKSCLNLSNLHKETTTMKAQHSQGAKAILLQRNKEISKPRARSRPRIESLPSMHQILDQSHHRKILITKETENGWSNNMKILSKAVQATASTSQLAQTLSIARVSSKSTSSCQKEMPKKCSRWPQTSS